MGGKGIVKIGKKLKWLIKINRSKTIKRILLRFKEKLMW